MPGQSDSFGWNEADCMMKPNTVYCSTFELFWQSVMITTKTVTLFIRIDPNLREAPRLIAEAD